jgi:hypothetical protein
MNDMHFCFATQTRRDGADCRDCRGTVTEVSYVLVIKDKALAYGPFATRDDAEYMAMDYYGTAITGASIKGEFLIAELRSGGDAPDRERDRHVASLMASDV